MKAVILAGGLGTRLSEETAVRPKPMIDIGGKPILWHIMKMYSAFGINEFVICLGYRGYHIKEYFANYHLHTSDVTFHMGKGDGMVVHASNTEPWTVTLVDTGEATMTGGRLKRVAPYLNEGTFCCTYGDGLSDVNIAALLAGHRSAGKLATMTVVQPPGRFGAVTTDGDLVREFTEKPQGDGNWINGGFFVLEPAIFKYIEGDATLWEKEPLERLARESQLRAHHHRGFWQPLDTLRDKNTLEALWSSGNPPWKLWT